MTKESVTQRLGLSNDHPMTETVWSAIHYLLSRDNDFPIHMKGAAPLDLFSNLLAKRLRYEKGEHDMVAMHHEFGIEHSSGQKVYSCYMT